MIFNQRRILWMIDLFVLLIVWYFAQTMPFEYVKVLLVADTVLFGVVTVAVALVFMSEN